MNVINYSHNDNDGYGSNLILNFLANKIDDFSFTCKNLDVYSVNSTIEDVLKDIKSKSLS